MAANRIEVVSAQLDRTLEFFGRVETKSSFLFGSNIGVATLLLFNLEPIDVTTWYAALPFVATLLLIINSTYHLLAASYPSLKGDPSSLFYFRSVGTRAEQDYVTTFRAKSDDELLSDLLGQVWRNSQILTEKFDHVTASFRQTVLALVPWTWFLIASAIVHGRGINLGS